MSDTKVWRSKPVKWVSAGLAGLLATIFVVASATWAVIEWIIGDDPETLDRVLGIYLIIFIGIVGVAAVGLIITTVNRRVRDLDAALPLRRYLLGRSPSAPAGTRWTFAWAAGILFVTLIAVPGAMVVAIRWLERSDFLKPEVILPIALIIGLVGLITALSALVAVFVRAGVTDKTAALGFPPGSVRALIALLLILMFAILAVFLYSEVRSGELLEDVSRADYEALLAQDRVVSAELVDEELDRFDVRIASDQQSTDIAKQLLTTLSTLVVALAAFYFGNRAVETAREAVGGKDESLTVVPNPDDGPHGTAVGRPVEIQIDPGDGVIAKVSDLRDPSAGELGTVQDEGGGRFTYQPERPGMFTIAFTRHGITRRLTVAAGVEVIEPAESPVTTGVDEPVKIRVEPVDGLSSQPVKGTDGEATSAATVRDDGAGEFTFTASAVGTFTVEFTAPNLTAATVTIEVKGEVVEVQEVGDVAGPEIQKGVTVPVNETTVVTVAAVPDLEAKAVDADGVPTDAVTVMDLPGKAGSFTVLPKEAGIYRLLFTAPGSPGAEVPIEVTPKPAGFEGTYTVRAGDTLSKIAARYDTTLDLLLENNPAITDPDRIDVGQKLDVPLIGTAESIQPVVTGDVAELAGRPPWLAIAEKEEETEVREIKGQKHAPRILEYHATTSLRATTDEVPWCSSFVNWCMEQAGIEGTRSASSRSWLRWSGGEKLPKPSMGSIVVFKRPPNPAHGHVAFYVGDSGPNSIMVLGGNQGNEVNRRAKQKSLVLGYIWPKGYEVPEDDEDEEKQPGEDWAKVSEKERRRLAMELLTKTHGYSNNAAAGIVGNLMKESAVIPNRLEGSAPDTPLKAPNFSGKMETWSPQEVQDRNRSAKRGPKLAGVGLAQWTAPARRKRLFKDGTDILFSMEDQIAFLVDELKSSYPDVEKVLSRKGVTVNDAADEFVYGFEKPASVLTPDRKKLRDRSDPSVQAEFAERRAFAREALREYRASVTEA